MTAGIRIEEHVIPDNIALRWMSNNLNLGYDPFDSIMHAPEIQAENLAKMLVKLSKELQITKL